MSELHRKEYKTAVGRRQTTRVSETAISRIFSAVVNCAPILNSVPLGTGYNYLPNAYGVRYRGSLVPVSIYQNGL
jgi:hypothetical protein